MKELQEKVIEKRRSGENKKQLKEERGNRRDEIVENTETLEWIKSYRRREEKREYL